MTVVVCVPVIHPAAVSSPRISDNFNRADQSPLGTASDGGAWTIDTQHFSTHGLDPALSTGIESNKAVLMKVDSGDGSAYFATAARLIPGSGSDCEFSIDVTRNRAVDNTIVLYLGSGPTVSWQFLPAYKFIFSEYAGQTQIQHRTGAGGSQVITSYSAWTVGQTRRFTVQRRGGTLYAFVDATLLGSWADPSPLGDTRWAVIVNGDYLDRFDNFDGGAPTL